MTREVSEKIVRGITDKIECNTTDIDDWAEFWGFTREDYEEFFDMAIEALEQEPSEDCVSRQEVITIIQNHWWNCRDIDKLVNELPPVTPTQGWISVTEDAPPIGTICLWCNKQGSVFVSEITYRSEKFSYVGQHGYFCNGLKNHGNIVAWQPLPKPYKAEMESEE